MPAPNLSIYGAEHFTVQLKSIPSRKAAEDFSRKLIAKGYTPDIVLADIPKVGLYYRIRVGKFRRLGDAQRLQRSLSGWAYSRKSDYYSLLSFDPIAPEIILSAQFLGGVLRPMRSRFRYLLF